MGGFTDMDEIVVLVKGPFGPSGFSALWALFFGSSKIRGNLDIERILRIKLIINIQFRC